MLRNLRKVAAIGLGILIDLQAANAQPPIILTVKPPARNAVKIPDESYGDWTVSFWDNGSISTTQNSAGHVLGEICFEGQCNGFVNLQMSCDEGTTYPALVNAPSSAFSVSIKCEKFAKLDIYTFPLSSDLINAMSIGGVLGIAFPMASGEFHVSRFSLTGAARAVARSQQVRQGTDGSGAKKDNYSL